MKLHYSQTLPNDPLRKIKLNYHMKLHYSQTYGIASLDAAELNYHMKLHYSQTRLENKIFQP